MMKVPYFHNIAKHSFFCIYSNANLLNLKKSKQSVDSIENSFGPD